MRLLPSALVSGLSLALLALPATARAAGFYVADVGTHGLARGGAFVADPDTALAAHYNPAGLSHLKGLFLEGDLSLIGLDFTFTRACPCADPAVPGAAGFDQSLEQTFAANPAHTGATHHIPYFAVGYGFPVYDLTVAFAGYGPNSGKYELGVLPPAASPIFEQAARRLPSRYTALTADTYEANLTLAFGLQPVRGLRVGGAAIVYQNANDQNLDLWVNSTTFATEPESTGFDVPIALRFRRDFALNFTLGATYEVLPGLAIGASFRGKRSVRADGTIDVDLPQVLKDVGAAVSGRDMEIELNTPPIARAGVQYTMPNVFKAEAAFVWEGWSTYDRIVIRPKGMTFSLGSGAQQMTQQLPKIVLDRGWADTWSLRIGGELNLFDPWLGVSAGWFYEPTGIPADRVDASRLDLDKQGFALGLRTQIYGATLEVAGMYILMTPVDVRDSKVKMIAPLEAPLGSPELITTIGNGRYEGSYVIGSASLSFALDPLMATLR